MNNCSIVLINIGDRFICQIIIEQLFNYFAAMINDSVLWCRNNGKARLNGGKMTNQKKRNAKQGLDTKQRIRQAGFKLFSQKGLHGTNSREIAAAAGVAIGSFYTYYKNKRILLIDLMRNHCGRVLEVLNAFPAKEDLEKDPRDVVYTMIRVIWDLHDSVYPLNQKALALRETDPEIDQIIEEQETAIRQRLVLVLKAAEPKLRIQNMETAAWLLERIILEVMHQVSRSPSQTKSDRIIYELVDMISRYLIR